MSLKRLQDDVKTAMKARDQERISVLRMAISHIKNARIEKGEDLTDDEVQKVLRRGLKQCQESATQYREGDRADLAEKEEREAAILATYLPKQLSGDDLAKAVDAAIAETGATSMKEMGAVMKAVMAAVGGQADGKAVQQLVRERLAG